MRWALRKEGINCAPAKRGRKAKKIIDLTIAGSPLRPKIRMATSADFPITDKTEFIMRPKIRMATSADFPITDKTEFIMPDPVNHPAHYTTGGIETIDFIEAKSLNYNLGNAVKYITRADHKGNRLQDLQKAKWYLEREILSAHI